MRAAVVAFGVILIALGTPGVASADSATALERRSYAALADTETALMQLWAERAAPLRAALAARTARIDEDQRALWQIESELARARTGLAATEGRLSPIDLERRDRVAAASYPGTTTLALATGRAVGPLAAGRRIAPAAGFTFAAPVAGQVTSPFGTRDGEFHDGIDIGTPLGAPVVASAAGTVVAAGQPYLASGDTAFGVIVDHGNCLTTLYWHLAPALAVRAGQRVEAGAQLGRIGLTGRVTGPHLHYSVLFKGRPVDPARMHEQTAP